MPTNNISKMYVTKNRLQMECNESMIRMQYTNSYSFDSRRPKPINNKSHPFLGVSLLLADVQILNMFSSAY